MKKLFILVAIVFAVVGSASASNNYGFMLRLGEQKTFNSVMRYIQADYDQKDQMKAMLYDSASRLDRAMKSKDDKAIEKAVYFNLANARNILSVDQYRKYLAVLNITLRNANLKQSNDVILAEK